MSFGFRNTNCSMVVFLALAYWFVVHMLNTFRARGYVTRFS